MEKKTVIQYFFKNFFNLKEIFDLSYKTEEKYDQIKDYESFNEYYKEELAKTWLVGFWMLVVVIIFGLVFACILQHV